MRTHSGFTIIELSAVIAVIAVVAVLSLVGYGSWRSDVGEAAAKSDLAGFSSGMESSRSWTDGASSGYEEFGDNTVFDGSGGTGDIFTQSDSVTVTYRWGTPAMYCVEAVSDDNPGVIYHINTNESGTTVNVGACSTEPLAAVQDNGGDVTTFQTSLSYPTGIAVDSAGNVYVAETGAHRILKITSGGSSSVFAGGTQGMQEGTGASARFNQPYGLAVDSLDNVYVADFGNERVRKITPGGVVSTYAGTGSPGAANGPALSATFNDLYGVAVDLTNDDVYVTETANQRVRKISAAGTVSAVAGSYAGYIDAQGTGARFDDPVGIARHSSGNLYVVENGNDRVRRIDSTNTVSTVAGSSIGYLDAFGVAARFNEPTGIGIRGDVAYIADSTNNRVRVVDLITTEVYTLAGSGSAGGTDGVGTDATFDNPTGIAISSTGIVYIVETNAGKIRRME